MISDGGVTLTRSHGDAAQSDSVEDDDVVADLGRLSDDHTRRVVDEDPSPDGGLGVDVHAGDGAGHGRQDACGGSGAMCPQGMGDAVGPESMHARVRQGNLQGGSGRRIAALSRHEVLAEEPKRFGG